MQNLKDLALTVSEKKATLRGCFVLFSNEETCQSTPLNMFKNQKLWYVHDLLDVINNRTKFQLNQIRTELFQLKLFDTAVILKHNQGH